MKHYLITFKNGIQNPVKIMAENEEMAAKEALAYHRKNNGFVNTVDLYSTVENSIDTVTEIKD